MSASDRVIAEARSWLGTPYHHAACVKGVGVDCAMLVKAVYEAAGLVSPFEVSFYPPDWHLHRDEERYLGFVAERASASDRPQPGDLALFRFGHCVSHGAIVIDRDWLIHSYIGRGVVLTTWNSPELLYPKGTPRLHSVWRVRGM